MENNNGPVAELKNVSKIYSFDQGQTAGVRDVSLRLCRKEFLLILGPSGSGKTTLLTLVAGLLKPTTGSVSLFGESIIHYSNKQLQRIRAEKIGFIFQNFLLIDTLTAKQNVELVLKFAGLSRSESSHKIDDIFEELKISYLLNKYPTAMSQGEKQRVAVARAIANDAELILADEPTASLETEQGMQIISLLSAFSEKKNKCVVVSSHDLRLSNYAGRIICLTDGKITAVNAPLYV